VLGWRPAALVEEDAMEIVEREIDGIKVLDLKGKIRGGEGDAKLQRRIAALIGAGHKHLIVNLGGVPYMDSSGLGELVRCFTNARKAGGQLKLSAPSRRLVDLLTVTKLNSIIETFDTDTDALESFGKGSKQ
jgi:anti-sigma B factor antagonist